MDHRKKSGQNYLIIIELLEGNVMKLSTALRKLAITMFAISASQAYSVGDVTGKITKIRVDNPSGQVMIHFDKDITGTPPGCVHSSYTDKFAVDSTTDGGKAALSAALMAKANQATVVARGKGACGVYGGSLLETLDSITIE